MESRPDLIPPCCAACWKAGQASVTWSEDAGWSVLHGTQTAAAANGAEAMAMLQALHYKLPPPGTS